MTASKLVQLYVSALRKVLEPGRERGDVLLTRPPGYLLRVQGGGFDFERFERLVGVGRAALAAGAPEVAERRLREALAVWRGPPLADLAFAPFAKAQIARLEELRLDALCDRIEADLVLGRTGVVGELEALIAAYPLRERLRGQLMLALYRSGRQAEALAAYQAARGALVDELGIEPSRELRDLERAILRQDPALERTQAPEPVPGPERSSLVGRERELAALSARSTTHSRGGGD